MASTLLASTLEAVMSIASSGVYDPIIRMAVSIIIGILFGRYLSEREREATRCEVVAASEPAANVRGEEKVEGEGSHPRVMIDEGDDVTEEQTREYDLAQGEQEGEVNDREILGIYGTDDAARVEDVKHAERAKEGVIKRFDADGIEKKLEDGAKLKVNVGLPAYLDAEQKQREFERAMAAISGRKYADSTQYQPTVRWPPVETKADREPKDKEVDMMTMSVSEREDNKESETDDDNSDRLEPITINGKEYLYCSFLGNLPVAPRVLSATPRPHAEPPIFDFEYMVEEHGFIVRKELLHDCYYVSDIKFKTERIDLQIEDHLLWNYIEWAKQNKLAFDQHPGYRSASDADTNKSRSFVESLECSLRHERAEVALEMHDLEAAHEHLIIRRTLYLDILGTLSPRGFKTRAKLLRKKSKREEQESRCLPYTNSSQDKGDDKKIVGIIED